MRLNASILYERLAARYPAAIYGRPGSELVLLAPEIYDEDLTVFPSNHIYLASADHLPATPTIQRNVVLVCISKSMRLSENMHLSYYKSHATVIVIEGEVDFFEVFRSLQEIYSLYQDWQAQLLELLTRSASIQDIVSCSHPVFENPLCVIDDSFHLVASAGIGNDDIQFSQGKLATDAFIQFLQRGELSMERHGAFILEMDVVRVLCVNLFNSSDEYIGCLFFHLSTRKFVDGEDKLAEYLAAIIQKIAEHTNELQKGDRGSLKDILQVLMNEMPLTQNRKNVLRSLNNKTSYVCISMHFLQRSAMLPVTYLCSAFEGIFAGSILFAHEGAIMGLVPSEGLGIVAATGKGWSTFSSFVAEMQLCVGISNDFSDLYMLRTYYFQAEAAIENGQLYLPGKSIYKFSEVALPEMISNALGNFSVEAYYPNGFRELLAHDAEGGPSYLETLSVFLDENMSYSAASRRLYIHRSSLVARIERIEELLAIDLDDPSQRLQMQIILKAIEMDRQLRQ